MEFLMTNQMDEKKTLKTGAAWYLLIPYVGIILSIPRKQFKAAINTQIVELIMLALFLVLFIMSIILAAIGLTMLGGLLMILDIFIMPYLIVIVSIAVKINLIKNMNNYTYNDYIKKGYVVDEIYKNNLEVEAFINRSQMKKVSKIRGIFII